MDATASANKQVKEPPPVPIKTYQWEDIRRARRKGGYPWTYLDKLPFDDSHCGNTRFAAHRRFEQLRKTKSTPDMDQKDREDRVQVEEINVDEDAAAEINMEVDVQAVKGMTLAEEYEYWRQRAYVDPEEEEEKKTPKKNKDSAANSSADVSISQYLDKDGKTSSTDDILAAPGASGKSDTLRSGRAKSEEPRRKRKHSIESSYSRVSKYSLSPKGIIKKLKEAKDKIKIPKFFKSTEEKAKSSEVAAEVAAKKPPVVPKSKKIEGPLVIHIPLKPPPGETDEFSYLEFESSPEKTGRKVSPIKEEEPKEEVPETPIESGSGVQLIILSPPSDDEILDTPAIPETPSEVDSNVNRMDELKNLARDVADKYSPETKRKTYKKEEALQKSLEESNGSEKEEAKKPEAEQKATKKKKVVKKVSKKKDKVETEEERVSEDQKTDDEKIEELSRPVREPTPPPPPKPEPEPEPELKPKGGLTLEERIAKMHADNVKGMTVAEEYEYWKRQAFVEPPTETTLTIDEEDGLKTEAVIARIIENDVKQSDKQVSKEAKKTDDKGRESPLLKKKVSFKRRSKEDADGIYEDVQVSSVPVEKPLKPNAEQASNDSEAACKTPPPSPTPLPVVDEKLVRMHEERVKGMTLAEEYEYWCKINSGHEYEPVNPPDDDFPVSDQDYEHPPKKPSTPITDSDIEYLAARAADIELRTTGVTVLGKEDPKEAMFVPLETALKEETKSTKSEGKEDAAGHGKKIQEAIQKSATNLKRQASIVSKKAGEQAEKIQTRVKSIKKPKIKMPEKPQFKKPSLPKLKLEKPHLPKLKIEKPKMPKIPDRMRNISLSLPRRMRRTSQRPTSTTESTVGDSDDKRTIFDFRTYPRMFRRRKQREDDGLEIHTPRTGTDITPVSERSTLPKFKFPRKWTGKFTEKQQAQQPSSTTVDTANSAKSRDSDRSGAEGSVRIPLHSERSMERDSMQARPKSAEREDSVERRMRLASNRFDDDIDMNDAYMKENQEIHRASSFNAKFSDRWNHGTFHDQRQPQVTDLDEDQPVKPPARSVLKKKIENIHAGSSDDIHRRGVLEEINCDEFFLRQKGISQDNIEVGAYLSSEIREAFRTPTNALSQLERNHPEAPKRRPFKKSKRKKTPHVSQEGIQQYDQESIHTEPDTHAYQHDADFETTASQPARPKRKDKHRGEDDFDAKYLEDEIIPDHEFRPNYSLYENEHMQGVEQPGIMVDEHYYHRHDDDDLVPAAPPRQNKSLRSLNASEHDSITGELNGYKDIHQDVNEYEHEYQIPTPDQPPKRPARTRSRTRSRSRGTALPDEETVARERITASQQSFTCTEEAPCRKVCCDYMGYPVADKSQVRDPPLPPSRRRSIKSEGPPEMEDDEQRFFTVPRSEHQPTRPLRNYSTLGPSRPPRKRSVPNLTDEEKNNEQYIEIEDDTIDHTKNLKSGEIIQKMKSRPLPAPPRPPRKSRDSSRGSRKSERDEEDDDRRRMGSNELQETEVSVQTEPLPDDFECEALVRDASDRIVTPTVDKYAAIAKRQQPPRNIREFEHQETITHGSLVVQPFAHGEEIPVGPIEMYSRSTERMVTVKREAEPYGDDGKGLDHYDETSEIPEEFLRLRSPTMSPPPPPPPHAEPQIIERIIERHIPIQLELPTEIETLKAQKLQVADLDVERLAVSELHASRITVGEIESSAINVNEINSESGNLVVSGIELPASFFQQLVEKLQAQAEQVAAAARPAPPPIEAPVRIVETKESETNTDTYQAAPVVVAHSFTEHTSARDDDAVVAMTASPEPPPPSMSSVIALEQEPKPPSPVDPVLESPSPPPPLFISVPIIQTTESVREYVGHEIDDVISTAQQAAQLELERDEPQVGQKKTPFEVRLVQIEKSEPAVPHHPPPSPPPRPPRAVKVESESVCNAPPRDETPPPRPPQPAAASYTPTPPSASSHHQRTQRSPPAFKDFDIDDDIPLAPRRRRHHHHHHQQQHHRAPESSSDDAGAVAAVERRRQRTPEPSIPQLTGQLTRACYAVAQRELKRLIRQMGEYVMGHADGKHEVNVAVVILIVFIALLCLIGWNGDGKQIHHHHWEYFNPPRDI